MGTVIKRGDSVPLTLDLGVDLAGYTTARVIVAARPGATPIVDRAGTISGQTVTITLTPAETATPGTYLVEVEMSPGPHTWPSDGSCTLRITPDLG